MTTTLYSPRYPVGYDVETSFASLSSLLDDDVLWPDIEIVQSQTSPFHGCTSSTLSSYSTGPLQHIVLDDRHVLGDETCRSDIQTWLADDASWSNSDELATNDQCLSHLLMTSQPGCHGNYVNVAAAWQSELLSDQLQLSASGLDRLHLVTSASVDEQEYCVDTSQTNDVQSSTFKHHAHDSDEGASNSAVCTYTRSPFTVYCLAKYINPFNASCSKVATV